MNELNDKTMINCEACYEGKVFLHQTTAAILPLQTIIQTSKYTMEACRISVIAKSNGDRIFSLLTALSF